MQFWSVAGIAVMLGSLIVYFWSLASTMQAQMRGTRAPPAHARLRISVFGAIFLGAGMFLLGTSLPPAYAVGPLVMAGLVFLFAFSVRFQ
jgi:hypothetical protein